MAGLAAAMTAAERPAALGILEKNCLKCHNATTRMGGLSLVTAADARKVIVPGKAAESRLVAMISGEKPRMPAGGAPLAAADVAAIRDWIDAGAAWTEPLGAAAWWSLKPLAKPAGEHTIDEFIRAKLAEKGLTPSPEADRATLIRRLTFDLHGLPPAWEEVKAFEADRSPDAYERLVDRLLASPRYGERWARHWLDVAHYGESHGYDKDKPRRNAWPYRDWVIRAFNEDKPYAQFVEEQLAGDVLHPDDPQAVVATGFIAAGPWDFVGHVELREGTTDKEITRLLDRDDMVMTTMQAFTSMTAHCARCHNHKFDPIPQEDYYKLQAVFAGVDRADRPWDKEASVYAKRRPLLEEQRRILAGEQPLLLTMTELAQVEHRMGELPKPQMVYAASPIVPREIHVLNRGNVGSPGKLAEPGALSCVSSLPSQFKADQRRAELARWITHRDNPLTWRSIVNRVWQDHFGAGIVDTPNDFGRMGSMPTHPELLDWLAADFRDHGGRLKRLHKMMVMSAAYRQRSANDPKNAAIDAGNQYLWRMNRWRLDAEAVRDATLAANGKLDLTVGGPSVEQFWFKDDHSPVYDYTKFDVDSPASYRRSIYRFIVRSVPDPFMDRLDCPDPSLIAARRNVTITAIQALALLNNPFMVKHPVHLAERVARMAPDVEGLMWAAYRLLLSREAKPEEAREVAEYARKYGMAAACRVLLNSNEFLFVD
jgi:hypothetical protein